MIFPKGRFTTFLKVKKIFVIQVLNAFAKQRFEHVKDVLGNPKVSPVKRLKDFYAQAVKMASSEEKCHGCLMNNMSVEMGGLSDGISQCISENYNRFMSFLATIVQEGQDRGEIKEGYNPYDLANFIHNSFNGALSRSKAARSSQPLEVFSSNGFRNDRK